jgi:TusA-related sulfurtransferase
MKSVDARGLSCPEPVLRTRNALQGLPAGEELEVLVETVTSRENVRRMAHAQGCQVAVEAMEDGIKLVIKKA